MTAPDGSPVETVTFDNGDVPQTVLFAFPGSAAGGTMAFADTDVRVDHRLPEGIIEQLSVLAEQRSTTVSALLDAARLLVGEGDGCPLTRDLRAAEMVLAAAGHGPVRLVRHHDIQRLETRIESLEYRGKALTHALARLSFQPLDGGIRDVRDAAQLFGFANEWCFDEDRVTRRFRELALVYHPDTGVVADRERMGQLVEARNLLIRHVRTAYASGQWAKRKR